MSWSIGYDSNWERDIGYDVPAICDHPKCSKAIHRGLANVCGGDAYGGEKGCGLFFCSEHLNIQNRCKKCAGYRGTTYKPKLDTQEWINHKMTDPSWAKWREENPSLLTPREKR